MDTPPPAKEPIEPVPTYPTRGWEERDIDPDDPDDVWTKVPPKVVS